MYSFFRFDARLIDGSLIHGRDSMKIFNDWFRFVEGATRHLHPLWLFSPHIQHGLYHFSEDVSEPVSSELTRLHVCPFWVFLYRFFSWGFAFEIAHPRIKKSVLSGSHESTNSNHEFSLACTNRLDFLSILAEVGLRLSGSFRVDAHRAFSHFSWSSCRACGDGFGRYDSRRASC